MTAPQPNGWFEKYVVDRFNDIADRFDRGAERMDKMDLKLDALNAVVPRIDERTRITAVLFGLLGGFLPAVVALIYFLLKGGL